MDNSVEEKDNVVDISANEKDELIKKLMHEVQRYKSGEDEKHRKAEKEYYIRKTERKNERVKAIIIGSIFLLSLTLLLFVSLRNPDIYLISKETTSFISQAINAFFLLIIPLILGSVGAIARIMVSGMQILKNLTLVLSSGLMAIFSWVGIKSELLISVIAPHIKTQNVDVNAAIANPQTEFYSMALVAILVGMFSSNVYIFINQKVESLTKVKEP